MGNFEDSVMDIKLLEETGRALYGDQWQSNLARSLEINSRNIRHWLKEQYVPDWLEAECKTLLEKNIKDCEEVLAKYNK